MPTTKEASNITLELMMKGDRDNIRENKRTMIITLFPTINGDKSMRHLMFKSQAYFVSGVRRRREKVHKVKS